MEENVFEVGDVLEIKGTYVLANDSIDKINRGLVVRSFVDGDENSDSTRCYVILVIPTEFRDNVDFTFKTKVRTLTEGFINKNSKKIDHVDLTPFVV